MEWWKARNGKNQHFSKKQFLGQIYISFYKKQFSQKVTKFQFLGYFYIDKTVKPVFHQFLNQNLVGFKSS